MAISDRERLFDALAADILLTNGRGRAIVAVDGVDGAGKSFFADGLAAAITRAGHPVFRSSIDGFYRSRAERHARGVDSPEGFYRDSFDYGTFRRVLVEPFRAGGSGSFVLAAFDHVSDSPVPSKWITGKQDAILVVDGIFLNRPELHGFWNYSIWLEVPAGVAEARLLKRDGESGVAERYTKGQELYRNEASPREAATVVIDNSDFDLPQREFSGTL
jgi:uridine kinase